MTAYVNHTDIVRDDLDTMNTVATVRIEARLIKPGMVLVDPELDTPAVEIDHRMRTVRNSGQVTFLGWDYDGKKLTEVSLRANMLVKVMAR